jgi:hypothetical protein
MRTTLYDWDVFSPGFHPLVAGPYDLASGRLRRGNQSLAPTDRSREGHSARACVVCSDFQRSRKQ